MITRVSETVAEIDASPAPKDNLVRYPWCMIEEVDFGAWRIAANAITSEVPRQGLKGEA